MEVFNVILSGVLIISIIWWLLMDWFDPKI
jgi:hypothetical protein